MDLFYLFGYWLLVYSIVYLGSMMNPRAFFRPDVEEFVRESLQLIFLQCLDKNYSGILFASTLTYFIINLGFKFKLKFSFKFNILFIASGFGYHFSAILDGLRTFANPSEACGWEVLKHIPHCYVTVRQPSGGFFSSVSVETPLKFFNDHFKRVCFDNL